MSGIVLIVITIVNLLHISKHFLGVPAIFFLAMTKGMEWWERMNALRAERGWTHEELARRSNVSSTILRKYASGEVKQPRGATLENIATAFNMSLVDFRYGKQNPEAIKTVALRGKVGAGAEVNLLNNDDFNETVDAPPNACENTIAVEISGDSMFPAYESGTVLYYSSNLPPQDMVNRRCVVKLADGRIFVKTLRSAGEGLWNLESLNPLTPTMVDQIVEWAAQIDWVKPR